MKTLAITATLLLAGCATGGIPGPDGRPMFHVEGFGATSAYKKAHEKCPAGYDMLTSRQQGVFFVMDIQCKGYPAL